MTAPSAKGLASNHKALDDVERSHEMSLTAPLSEDLKSNAASSITCDDSRSLRKSLSSNQSDHTSSSFLMPSKKRAEQEKLHHLKQGKNRLQTSQLYGRDSEILHLQTTLETVATTPTRAWILIEGASGTGKTRLASSALQSVVRKRGGLYVYGKFDLFLRDEPYYGIAAAGREICGELLQVKRQQQSNGSTTTIHNSGGLFDQLVEKLGADLHLLAKVIPELTEVVDMPQAIEQNLHHSSAIPNQQEAHARLHYVFRVFLRIITSFYAPLVITLDDLQWVDEASLELMQVFLTDLANPHFMMIGLYRSNEVDEEHRLAKVIRSMQDKSEETPGFFSVSKIQLGNLSVEAVHSILMDKLSVDHDTPQIQELASVCHKRVHGNVFFLMAFLEMLQAEGLLDFDLLSHKFTWDIHRIKSETAASSNVVDLVKEKMGKLPSAFGHLLSMASCLGSTFAPSHLQLAWGAFEERPLAKDTTVEEMLLEAVEEGFLETMNGSSNYRWTHDKVQEAAFSNMDDASDFKFRVGDVLFNRMSEEDLDASIFIVVNLLNEKPKAALRYSKQIDLARLNLRATKKAMSQSAFPSAAKFARKGVDFLPTDCWKEHYDLTLELYSCAAEAEEFIGNKASMQTFCDTVLEQTQSPIADKLRIYNVLVSSMANSGQHVEATALTLKVLGYLGCKFPKSAPARLLATLAGLVRAKSSLKCRTPDEIEQLPIMQDAMQIETMRLLDKLALYSYLCGSDVCVLAIMRSMRLTLQHGLCDDSPPAFASFVSVVLGVLGDIQGGKNLGEYSVLMLTKLGSRSMLARTKFIAGNFAFTWTRPFQNLSNFFLETYRDGMLTGDTESAMYAVFCHIMMSYFSGRPLKFVEADCANYSQQMKELHRHQAYDYTQTFLQAVLNLRGQSEHTTRIEGDRIEDADQFLQDRMDNPPMVVIFRAHEIRLNTIFCKYEQGAELFISHGWKFPEAAPGHCMFMEAVFCGGLCCFEMARSRIARKKYKKHANKALSTIQSWVRQGNPNVRHHKALLEAEMAVLRGRHKLAEQHYQSAISIAARAGVVHDAALANERYGQFLRTVLLDKGGAAFQLDRALEFYTEWGADAKVRLMRHVHNDLLSEKAIGSTAIVSDVSVL